MERSGPFDVEVDLEPPRAQREGPGRDRRPPRPPRRARRAPRIRGPQGEPPRRTSETLARVAWALPWIAGAIAIVVAGGLAFTAAMIALACVGLTELFRMTRTVEPLIPVAFAATSGIIAAAYYGDHFQIVLALAASFPLIFAAGALRGDREGVTGSVAITVFGLVWIAIPFAHAVLLRELPDHGAALLVDVLVATIISDTAAYAGGRLFGSHRIAPVISPNKTLEGLAFGFAGGTVAFWFAGLYQDWLPGLDALLMGMCVAAIAPLGDLFESMIKRDLRVKDSGNVFGPHCGLLDRVDALLFTIVAGYYLAIAFVY
jgi:phosphatidate cytidylyltransferase